MLFNCKTMAIHSDLKKLFPNFDMKYCLNSATISESDAKASIKELNWTDSSFHVIDTEIIKAITSFFQKSGSADIFKFDCDGIVIFEENGKKYIFLSELKSGFSSQYLDHAKDQLISSFIKLNMILHLLPGYNKKDYIFKAFIVSSPSNPNYLRDLYKQTMLPKTSRFKTEAEFTYELCYCKNKNKCVSIKAIECEQLKELPLGSNCLFNDLEIHFIDVPKGSNSTSLSVHKYI